MITYEQIKNNEAIKTYIQSADETLKELGFTEHSFTHVTYVAEKTAYILETLGYPERTIELTKIAGYMHDIGNERANYHGYIHNNRDILCLTFS